MALPQSASYENSGTSDTQWAAHETSLCIPRFTLAGIAPLGSFLSSAIAQYGTPLETYNHVTPFLAEAIPNRLNILKTPRHPAQADAEACNVKFPENSKATTYEPSGFISVEGDTSKMASDSFADGFAGEWPHEKPLLPSANEAFHRLHPLPSLALSSAIPACYAESSSYGATPSPCISLGTPATLLSPGTVSSSEDWSRRTSLTGLTTTQQDLYVSDAGNRGKVGTHKSCVSCYNRIKCDKPGGLPNFCFDCFSKNGRSQYCRGPIEIPCVVDTDVLYRVAKNLLKTDFPTLHSLLPPSLRIDLGIGPVKDPLTTFGDDLASTNVRWSRFEIDVNILTNESGFGTYSTLGDFLDLLLPDAKWPSHRTTTPDSFRMDALKGLASRFVACMTLLGQQDTCFMESSLASDSSIPYIVLDWLRQITAEASESLTSIYQEIRLFVIMKRPKKKFAKWIKETAWALGHMYKSIWTCHTSTAGSLTLQNLGFNVGVVSDNLSYLAKGIDEASFKGGCDADLLAVPCIRIFQNPGGNTEQQSGVLPSTDVSILDLVTRSSHLFSPAASVRAPDPPSALRIVTSNVSLEGLSAMNYQYEGDTSGLSRPRTWEEQVGDLPFSPEKEILEQELSHLEQRQAEISRRPEPLCSSQDIDAQGNSFEFVESATISPDLFEYQGGALEPGRIAAANPACIPGSDWESLLCGDDDDTDQPSDMILDPISDPVAIACSSSASPASQESLDYEEICGSHSTYSQTLVPDLGSREHPLKRKPKCAISSKLVKKVRSTIKSANSIKEASSETLPSPTSGGVARLRSVSSALSHVLGIGHHKTIPKPSQELRGSPKPELTPAYEDNESEGIRGDASTIPSPVSPKDVRRVQSDGWKILKQNKRAEQEKGLEQDTVNDMTASLKSLRFTI